MMKVKTSWKALGNSVKGESHKRSGLGNQDDISLFTDTKSETGLPAIMAVSDGHGSPSYFRSKRGAQLAVKVATYLLKNFFHTAARDNLNERSIKDWVNTVMPKKIVQLWVEQVLKDIKKHPYSEEERTQLKDQSNYSSDPPQEIIPYGATLLAVLLTEHYCVYFQLGDGDILRVYPNNTATRVFPKDNHLVANETHSLSEPEAWRNSRSLYQPFDTDIPELILASTDGYSNSFESDEEFLQVGTDILNIIHDKGMDYLTSHLESWLTHASKTGSGDDVTLGILSCANKEEEL